MGISKNPRMVSPGIRFKILERDNFTCIYCGNKSTEAKLHIDHIIPYSRGGETTIHNLATACSDCNLGKKARKLSSEQQILEIVRKRNEKNGYVTNEDLKPPKGKKEKKPKMYGPKMGRKISFFFTFEIGKDNERIARTMTQSMTKADKLIALTTLAEGVYKKDSDGELESCTKEFTAEEFKEKIGIELNAIVEGSEIVYFSAKRDEPATRNVAITYADENNHKIYSGINFLHRIRYHGGEQIFQVTLNMTHVMRLFDEIIDALSA